MTDNDSDIQKNNEDGHPEEKKNESEVIQNKDSLDPILNENTHNGYYSSCDNNNMIVESIIEAHMAQERKII